jgi:predicted aminopeptidase
MPSRPLRRLRPALAALLLGAAAAACSPTYVLRAAWEEAKILSRRQPITHVIADTATAFETRGKLMLVLQARGFAADSLGLNAGRSYTLYSHVDSDTLIHLLSAAYPDRFEPYTWWFPIVGRVPYKGFFREGDALSAMRSLDERGFDTYVRPAAAFSTLGWFNDPLLSTLLRYDDLSLANTVIHEILHNTFYASGQAAFNESFANFVGGVGAIHFFCGRDGGDSATCRTARAAWADDLRFGAFLSTLVDDLETLYAREDLTREQKLTERETVFTAAQTRFREELQPTLEVQSFAGFARAPLNNATLIGRRLYYRRLDLFDEVYRSRGGDLRATLHEIVAAARGSSDPYAAVEAMLPAREGL